MKETDSMVEEILKKVCEPWGNFRKVSNWGLIEEAIKLAIQAGYEKGRLDERKQFKKLMYAQFEAGKREALEAVEKLFFEEHVVTPLRSLKDEDWKALKKEIGKGS